MARWDEILLSLTKIPSDDVLESLYELRIREYDQLETVLELYDMEMHQKISMPNYQKLMTMVKRSVDQKLRFRNFDARNERIETGAVVSSRRRSSGIERGKGVCCLWKANAVSGTTIMSVQNPTPNTAPSSEPPTPGGRSASRRRNLRGQSPSGKSNRQPCKNFLKGTCTKSRFDEWHPPECQFYKSESGCKFDTECSFPLRKVEEQPNKRPKKGW